MLRQSKNYVFIEGIVSENNLQTGSYVNNAGKTIERMGGHLVIKVTQPVNGVPVDMDINVDFYAEKYKKAGGLNQNYAKLFQIKDDLVSIAQSNEQDASRVRISRAELYENLYYKDGKFITFPKIRGTFIDLIPAHQCNPKATFEIEVVIGKKGRAVDSEGIEIEPLKYDISAVTVRYGERVEKLAFTTYNPEVANYFEKNINLNPAAPNTVALQGLLNYSAEEEERPSEVAVGVALTRTVTNRTSELIIIGVSDSYEGDFAYDFGEIKEGLAQREARKEYEKERAGRAKVKNTPAPATAAQMADEISDPGF